LSDRPRVCIDLEENVDKFLSRKLILTSLAIVIVASSDLLGLELDDQSLNAITTMILGFVGGQSLVDVSSAIKTGRKLAETVEDVKEAATDGE
jgi:hypothetical protein